jgi:hypothetical protein
MATVEKDRAQEMTIEEWLAIRKEAGLKIDPQTAKITWHWAQVLDPYGVLELAKEDHCVGRSYFARSPESDVWVSFYDLPKAAVTALWKKVETTDDWDDDWPF